MNTQSYAFRAADPLRALAPTGPAGLLERELYGEFQARPRRRVRTFTCGAADLVEVGRIVGRTVTRTELLAAVETAAGTAVLIAGRAAAALEASPRSATTRRLFCEAFGVNPEFVPPWRATLPGRVRWRDLGELVAIRLRSAARIVDGGFIRYFCWIRLSNCPECPRSSRNPGSVFACSSFRGDYRICLGGGFWRAFRDGDRATMASTLLHEALHIYFGRTVQDAGRTGNANCYERFAIRFNRLRLAGATNTSCPAGACRITPRPRPAAPRVLDGFAHNSNVLTSAHNARIAAIARDIAASSPLVSRVRLVGHTDSTGPAPYNVTLGANRAQAVRQALVRAIDNLRAGHGQRIQWIVESRGEAEPASANSTAAGRARNRRVHVYVGG